MGPRGSSWLLMAPHGSWVGLMGGRHGWPSWVLVDLGGSLRAPVDFSTVQVREALGSRAWLEEWLEEERPAVNGPQIFTRRLA
ncbi:hypothetical protein E4U42_000416, partial [Claviceps africana]